MCVVVNNRGKHFNAPVIRHKCITKKPPTASEAVGFFREVHAQDKLIKCPTALN